VHRDGKICYSSASFMGPHVAQRHAGLHLSGPTQVWGAVLLNPGGKTRKIRQGCFFFLLAAYWEVPSVIQRER